MSIEDKLTVYQDCAPVADVRFGERSNTTLEEAVVYAIAAAEGVDPTDLSSLYDSVDLDAVSTLFDQSTGDQHDGAVYGFTVDDWCVFVRGDGHVRVCDPTQPTDPQPVFGTGVQ